MGVPAQRSLWPLLFAIFIGALVFRFLPVRWVFQPDGVRFYDSDSYYHMRRVWMCIEHFPRVPIHDPFENHPFGGVTMWPPLHDALITAVILAFGGRHPSVRLVESVGAVAPAVLGALAIFPLYTIGRRLLGRREGLIAAALMAIQPAHILYSAVGRPDQHVTEILLSALLYASVLGFSAFASAERRGRWTIWWPRVLAGITATAAVLVWMGSLLFVCIAAGFGGLALVGRIRAAARPIAPLARDFAWFLAIHVATLAAGSAYLLAGMEVENTYVSFSWFQAHFSGLLAVAFLVATLTLVAIRDGLTPALRTLAAPLAALALVALLLVPTRLGGTIGIAINAIHHVNKTTTEVASSDSSHHLLSYNALWLRSIQEYTPLLYPNGKLDPRWALDYVGPILFLAPISLTWLLVRRRGAPREMRWLVAVWTIGVAAMALSQVKYVYLASSLAALLVADLVGEVWYWGGRLRWPDGVRSLAASVAAVALVTPGLRYLSHFNAGYVDLPEHQRAALLALREFSPDPGSFTDPAAKPSYGVMGFWDLGNYAEYLCRRPVVANNNGYGFDDSIAFFLAPTEDDAIAILERRDVRYVVASDLVADIATLHEQLTGSLTPYFRADASRRLTLEPPFAGLVYARLFFGDGTPLAAESGGPLERFRLVYEAPGRPVVRLGRIVAPSKIFERVAGARVAGNGFEPGSSVVLRTALTSNLGRSWVDERSATVAPDGTFMIRLPYGAADGLPVRPTSWTLSNHSGATLPLVIPEEAALSGAMIEVHAP